jgi:hypothetical protein
VLPPVPVQVRVYVEVLVSAPVDCELLVGSEPDQAPEAVQEEALVEDQVSVEVPPLATLVGLALSEAVGAGAGAATVTVADWAAEPPLPLQVSVYLVVAVRMPVLCEPLLGSLPVQPPDAVQEEALVEDQVKVEVPPLVAVPGLAVSVTDGAGAVTVTVADCAALPPLPLQVSV